MGMLGVLLLPFTSQVWNSQDNIFVPTNALLIHLGINSFNLGVPGCSRSRIQKPVTIMAGTVLFSGSDLVKWSLQAP